LAKFCPFALVGAGVPAPRQPQQFGFKALRVKSFASRRPEPFFNLSKGETADEPAL